MSDITVILTGYNRPQNMKKQLEAIKAQTVQPDDIMMWYNQGEQPQRSLPNVKTAHCNFNAKFHGRFAFALLVRTKYVCIFDDDCIPGERWLENCLNSFNKQEGLYGTVGIVLQEDKYLPHRRVGSATGGIKNEEISEVDLVGWSWFFPRYYLKYFWELDPISWDNGEDIQFSYILNKHNINTFVPPHPQNDMTLWGTTEPRLGSDKVAHHLKNKQKHLPLRNKLVTECINLGWKTVKSRR